MKRLGLFRHAKSDWDDMSLRDFDRGLNARGRKGAALMGKHISQYGAKWDIILASPAQRIRQTLAASGLDAPITFEDSAYLGDSAALIGLLNELKGDPGAVLLAAHNPGLQEVALDLVGPEKENALFLEIMAKYPTAAFTVIELDIDKWEDCRKGCGSITHFARPRDLDPELGPETFN